MGGTVVQSRSELSTVKEHVSTMMTMTPTSRPRPVRRGDALPPVDPKRRGPLGAGPDEELVGHIRLILTESPFHGEGDRKVWARLRSQGIRTSKEPVRRLMRQHGLQAP
jgi:hypothetical protein